MKKEDELYIESYLSRVIELSAEVSYSVDKLGNIIFEDKNKVKENINRLIFISTQKIEASEEEIREYLINIYRSKSNNPIFSREGTELISILEELKADKKIKEEDNKVGEEEKNNTERS